MLAVSANRNELLYEFESTPPATVTPKAGAQGGMFKEE
jgi:hypothetical protein